jgi:hypothetical protein
MNEPGFADLATKKDLEILEHRSSAKIDESARRPVRLAADPAESL